MLPVHSLFMRRHRIRALAVLLGVLSPVLVSGCSGESATEPPPTPVAPVADFSTTSRLGVSPLTVAFRDESAPGTAAITAWAWTFGDGATSTEQHPTHIYTSNNTFTVSLRVTSAAGTNEKTTAGFIESYSLIVVDGAIGAVPGQSPAIPVPTSYSQILGTSSPEMQVGTSPVLPVFTPWVSQMRIRQWGGDSDFYIDCPGGIATDRFGDGAGAAPAWASVIPRRNTTNNFIWLTYPGDDAWPGTLPNRVNVYSNQYGFAGGSARWSSCEERGSLFDEWTSHVISYNERATTTPIIRHYTKWTKAVDVPLGSIGGTSTSYNVAFGVTRTEAFEFTRSITASVGVEVEGFSANLETTLSQTFSSAIAVETRTETTRSFTSGLPKANYEQRFYVWQLVDVYQIEGSVPGQPWSDPNFVLRNAAELRIESPRSEYAVVSVWFRR